MREVDNVKVTHAGSTQAESAPSAGAGEEEVAGEASSTAADTVSESTAVEFTNLTRRLNYYDQAAFFLNAFWLEFEGEAETIFQIAKSMAKQDSKNGENGTALDEVNARKILQDLDMA